MRPAAAIIALFTLLVAPVGSPAEVVDHALRYVPVVDAEPLCRAALEREFAAPKARLRVDEHSNTLTVDGPREELELLARLLAEVDVRPDLVAVELLVVAAMGKDDPVAFLRGKLGDDGRVFRGGARQFDEMREWLCDDERFEILASGKVIVAGGRRGNLVVEAGGERTGVTVELAELKRVANPARIAGAGPLPDEFHVRLKVTMRSRRESGEFTLQATPEIPDRAAAVVASGAHRSGNGPQHRLVVLAGVKLLHPPAAE